VTERVLVLSLVAIGLLSALAGCARPGRDARPAFRVDILQGTESTAHGVREHWSIVSGYPSVRSVVTETGCEVYEPGHPAVKLREDATIVLDKGRLIVDDDTIWLQGKKYDRRGPMQALIVMPDGEVVSGVTDLSYR